MSEILHPIPKENIENVNIFNISQKTNTIISCIQGIDSSTKLTKKLIEKGNENFSCLSGGIIGLGDFLNDEKTLLTINNGFYDSESDIHLKQRIRQETNFLFIDDYYQKLTNKKIFIITHSLFLNLKNSIIEDFFIEKNIYFSYFPNTEKLMRHLKDD